MADHRSMIIVGVGPLVSLSLCCKLASEGWHLGLVSRSVERLASFAEQIRQSTGDESLKLVFKAADGGQPEALAEALDWTKKELGSVDVLCYNAARVGSDPLMTVTPAVLEADFKTSVLGTLVAGQWFAENANKSRIADGEYPLLLIPAGGLHIEPRIKLASLSTVKSASYNLSVNFSQLLPKEYQVMVGIPLIMGYVRTREDAGEDYRFDPDVIVDKIFTPFFEQRKAVIDFSSWVRDRAW
ncbi:MAG: hypothetical protein M4579_002340 [Chaenotheca gracillima]|nr:MAG: hypothetical protein M4579_002340 [Chaenotheca gracillima]